MEGEGAERRRHAHRITGFQPAQERVLETRVGLGDARCEHQASVFRGRRNRKNPRIPVLRVQRIALQLPGRVLAGLPRVSGGNLQQETVGIVGFLNDFDYSGREEFHHIPPLRWCGAGRVKPPPAASPCRRRSSRGCPYTAPAPPASVRWRCFLLRRRERRSKSAAGRRPDKSGLPR